MATSISFISNKNIYEKTDTPIRRQTDSYESTQQTEEKLQDHRHLVTGTLILIKITATTMLAGLVKRLGTSKQQLRIMIGFEHWNHHSRFTGNTT